MIAETLTAIEKAITAAKQIPSKGTYLESALINLVQAREHLETHANILENAPPALGTPSSGGSTPIPAAK